MRGRYGLKGEFIPANTQCENQGLCPYDSCFSDDHHLFWEKRQYRGQIEKAFRNLGENVIELGRCQHDELHATVEPPEKPPRCEMIEAILDDGMHLSRSLRREIREAEQHD